MNQPNLIDTCRDALDLLDSGLATREQMLASLDLVKRLGEVYRAMKEHVESAATKWVQANGPFEDGTTRYYVGTAKKTKCRNLRATVEAIMQATGGDLDALVDCLASDAFKPGETRKTLGDDFPKCFDVTEAVDLKSGAVKPPKLQVVDTKFLK